MLDGILDTIRNALPTTAEVRSTVGNIFSKYASGGVPDHIQFQNETVSQMGNILDIYDQYKNAGQLTPAIIDQTIAAIAEVDSEFNKFARQIGTDRAMAGANDVHALAIRVIAGLQSDRSSLGYGVNTDIPIGTTGIPVGTTVYDYFPNNSTRQPFYSGIGGSINTNTVLVAGLGIAAVLLISKKR